MKKPYKVDIICCAIVSTFFAVALVVLMRSMIYQMESVGTAYTSSTSISLPCQYGDCGAECTKQVKVLLIDPYRSRIRENENYSISGRSYDKTETGYVPKKDTYLVPTDKGLKVETERGWEEKTYVTGTVRSTTVEGYYCEQHTDAGRKLIEDEVKHAFIWTGTSIWILVLAVLAVLPWALLLWFCVKGWKKHVPARMETNAESQTP